MFNTLSVYQSLLMDSNKKCGKRSLLDCVSESQKKDKQEWEAMKKRLKGNTDSRLPRPSLMNETFDTDKPSPMSEGLILRNLAMEEIASPGASPRAHYSSSREVSIPPTPELSGSSPQLKGQYGTKLPRKFGLLENISEENNTPVKFSKPVFSRAPKEHWNSAPRLNNSKRKMDFTKSGAATTAVSRHRPGSVFGRQAHTPRGGPSFGSHTENTKSNQHGIMYLVTQSQKKDTEMWERVRESMRKTMLENSVNSSTQKTPDKSLFGDENEYMSTSIRLPSPVAKKLTYDE